MWVKLLRALINRIPAIPQLEDDFLSDDAFYDGEISEWTEPDSSEMCSQRRRNVAASLRRLVEFA